MLKEQVAVRLRDLIRQGYEVRGITIIKGSIGKDYVHRLLECPPQLAPSKVVQYLRRTVITTHTRRISSSKEEVLGAAFVGKRVFLRNSWHSYWPNDS